MTVHPACRQFVSSPIGLTSILISLSIASILYAYAARSEEHTSELQSRQYLVCRLLLEKKKQEEILVFTLEVNEGIPDLVKELRQRNLFNHYYNIRGVAYLYTLYINATIAQLFLCMLAH